MPDPLINIIIPLRPTLRIQRLNHRPTRPAHPIPCLKVLCRGSFSAPSISELDRENKRKVLKVFFIPNLRLILILLVRRPEGPVRQHQPWLKV